MIKLYWTKKNGKTENAERTIFITSLLREILERRVNENDPESLVFSDNGKLISVATLNTHFKKICKNAGIRLTTYMKKKPNGTYTEVKTSEVFQYQLRHLFASLGVLIKAEPKALQKLMGHRKISVLPIIFMQMPKNLYNSKPQRQ